MDRFLPLSIDYKSSLGTHHTDHLLEHITGLQQKKPLLIMPWFDLSLTLGDVN